MKYRFARIQKKSRRSLPLFVLTLVTTLMVSGCAQTVNSTVNLPNIDLGATESPTPIESPSVATGTFSDAFAELEMEDQSGDGTQVSIEEVRIAFELGFIGVFDLEGNLLGFAKVTDQSQPVAVKLEKAISSSTKLLAKLYADNGDGTFDPSNDLPVLDDDRELVIEDFDYQLSK